MRGKTGQGARAEQGQGLDTQPLACSQVPACQPLVWVSPGWRRGWAPLPPSTRHCHLCLLLSVLLSLCSAGDTPSPRGSPENRRACLACRSQRWPCGRCRHAHLGQVFVAGSPLRLLARAAELVGPQIGFQMLVGRAPCWDQGVSPLCHSLECLLPQCTEPLTGHLLPSQAACDAHGLGGLLAWPVTAPAAQVEVTVSQGGSLGLPLSSPRASPANPPCVCVCMRVRCMHTCVHVCYL